MSVASIYPDWRQHAERLRDGVVGLTSEQLAIRAGPDHAPIWALAAHVAGARAYWLCGLFEVPGAERTPWKHPLTDDGWEDDESHPRSPEELRWALDSTWEVIEDCLEHWTIDGLQSTATRLRADGMRQIHTRASILNRLFTHEAFHAGDISQLLGLHGLEAIDIWAKPWTE
jgi:uncharacterized damage-inducible protein DinB